MWLISGFSTACVNTSEERLAAAQKAKAEANVVDTALKRTPLPALPPDCRVQEKRPFNVGDRLDTSLLKSDAARQRGNARTARCAAFYDNVKAGRG